MRYGFTVLTSMLVTFFMTYYMPLVSYYRNVNEFVFNETFLLESLIVPAVIIFCISIILLEVAGSWLPNIQTELFGGNSRISILNIFIILLIVCFWVEGSVLSKGLPSITGEVGLFLVKKRIYADIIVLCSIILCSVFLWKKLSQKALLLHLSVFVLMAAAIGDAYISKEVKIPVYVTRHEVLKKLKFHSRDNIIIIMADSVPTKAALSLLHEQPDYFKEFDGFTLFRNNLGTGDSTTWAKPAILKGALFEGGSYAEFAISAVNFPGSLPQKFKTEGYAVYISSMLPRFCVILNDDASASEVTVSSNMDLHLYVTQCFPFIPYVFKEYAASYIAGRFLTDLNIYSLYILPKLEVESSNRPTLHLHHLKGVHPPYVMRDENGEPISTKDGFPVKNKETFSLFANFLKELKLHNLYDDAIILLIADHGIGGIYEEPLNGVNHILLPLVMVKPKQAKGKLIISDAPFSSSYIVSLLDLLKNNPENFEKYCESLPKERYVFIPEDKMMVKGKDPVTASVSVTKNADFSSSPTTLKMNTNYTLNLTVDSMDMATPFLREQLPYSPSIALFGQRNGIIGFVIDGGQFVNIIFDVGRYDSDLESKTAPFPLIVTDLLTGLELYKAADYNPALTGVKNITLKNVAVNKEGKIYLHLASAESRSTLLFKKIQVQMSKRVLPVTTHEYPLPVALPDILMIKNALEVYYKKNNAYPVSDGYSGLYSKWGYSGPDWIKGLAPEYLPKLPRDSRNTDNGDEQYLYFSDGKDYKLLSHIPIRSDMLIVRRFYPELLDPARPGWAFGFWTEGAANK